MIIPRSNAHNLMLRKDIIHAVEKGKFHIYAIDHVSEAIELFTGTVAGKPDARGKFKPDTVLHRAHQQLENLRPKDRKKN